MRTPASLLAAVACSLLASAAPARAGVVFDAHKWRWQDLMSHMAEIRQAGFTAILISPHQSSCGGPFSDGYDPSDYTRFDSRFGSESDLFWLIGTAHWQGLDIYADMVMNHMCPGRYSYPRFGWNDFHHNGDIRNWNDVWWLENGDLFGLADLAHESSYTRGQLWNFLVQTNNLGFDGYRWDAAKHVPVWYWRDHVVHNVNRWGKYSFGEVVSGDPAVLDQYVAAGMAVTDYGLYDAMQRAFRFGGNLAELAGAGYAARNGGAALTFVENHDVGAPPNRWLAHAFLAAYPGYPSFYQVGLGDRALANLIWIHDNLAHGPLATRLAERDVLVFEREGHLLAAFNQTGGWVTRWVFTGWRDTRLHDYAGATGDLWTNGAGWVEIAIPPTGYIMLAPG